MKILLNRFTKMQNNRPRYKSSLCSKALLTAGILLAVFVFNGCFSKKENIEKTQAFANGMVVTAHPQATLVGLNILKQGGNAIDAAIAVQFALAVVYPNAGNIGGGGFMVYRKANGEAESLDFREKAPLKAKRDMFLDSLQNPAIQKSLLGHLASGVPGSVDGMWQAHQKFGKLSWQRLLQPAITLAKTGFKITARQARELNAYQTVFERQNKGYNYLINKNKWTANDLLIQTDLANTLSIISQKGRDGFYDGAVADMIVKEMNRGNGIISLDDLKNYHAIWRKPLRGNYKNYKIITMPPPSAGGIALLQLLQMVEPYNISKHPHNATKAVQIITEAERRVYADRSKYLGDPDFYNVPIEQLLNPVYNQNRMKTFNWDKATLSSTIQPGTFTDKESPQTTHFSITDKAGNAVAITTTLNDSYGSKTFVKGAGFLLNNEMDDFSVKPGSPNMYGLIGGEANAIVAGKRMLSSMTPTIIEKNNKLFMVVGTPGGSTIVTTVFQTVLNVIEYKMDMQEAVNAKRFHHQWLPDVVETEDQALDSVSISELKIKGYKVMRRGAIGRCDAILVDKKGAYSGGADPRGDDSKMGY